MSGDIEKKSRPASPHPSYTGVTSDRHATAISTTSLTHAGISKALLDSIDEGRTLDFSHKNITDVGEAGAEELASIGVDELEDECIVSRVALGYNRLSTLPMAFALLTRLRYLNLRANSFTVFPEVLTVMPSLEILDISRNKLKRLPSQPGTLLGLRVLCLARNRLTRLPSYMSKASQLTVLQLDQNPLEWPPKSICEPLEGADNPETVVSCIDAIRKWIADHSSDGKGDQDASDFNEEITYSSQLDETDFTSEDVDHKDGDDGIFHAKHSRSFSADSNVSKYSIASHESSTSDMSFYATSDNELSSMDITYPPVTSVHNTNGSIPPKVKQSQCIESTAELSEDIPQRFRGSTRPSKLKKNSPDFTTKFSLPHLPRERHGMLRSRAYTSDGSMQSSEGEISSQSYKKAAHRHETTPQGHEDYPASSNYQGNHNMSPLGSNGRMKAFIPPPVHTVAPPMDVERNSYFRRISTLPSSTIQTAMPKPLLAMVESARGILFAVSQIYQSLRHYIVFAIDDRLSGLLSKVLEPASQYMSHLIGALDRFDSVSRRSIPPPHICRNVLESCKDIVSVFGKVIGVLHIQLKVLAGADDARYSRSLLLMLYGSMVEISHSWQTLTPHLDSLAPHLKDPRIPPSVSKGGIQATPLTPLNGNGMSSQPTSSSTPRTPASATSLPDGRVRLNRRHAGSFSSKDVEMGKAMLSDPITETPISATAPLRSALRRPSSPQNIQANSSTDSPSDTLHQRGAISSPAAINTSTSLSSFTFPSPNRQTPSGNKSGNFLETPTESSKIMDANLLDTMEAAVETAGSVWKMLDDVLRHGDNLNSDFSAALQTAQSVTDRLAENIRSIRGKSLDSNRKALWEDAHTFVKTVVNVLTLIKACSNNHPFSSSLRNNIAKLTQSTQDFAILLQVSSFSPAPTPSLYQSSQTPVTPAKPSGPSIGRSRSAQANSKSPKSIKLNEREPWSALPNQSFKIPTDAFHPNPS